MIKATLQREPVMTAASIVGAIMAFLTMAVTLGWVDLSGDQLEAIGSFVKVAVPLVGLLIPIIGGLLARRAVTPVADPRTNDGKPAALVPRP